MKGYTTKSSAIRASRKHTGNPHAIKLADGSYLAAVGVDVKGPELLHKAGGRPLSDDTIELVLRCLMLRIEQHLLLRHSSTGLAREYRWAAMRELISAYREVQSLYSSTDQTHKGRIINVTA